MPKFNYHAKNSQGQDVSGIVEADSQKIALSLLKDKGYIVYSLNLEKKGFKLKDILNWRGVSDTEKVNFTQTLSSMITSGLPLASALEILVDQAESTKMKEVVQTALKDVNAGTPLSDSLEKHPDVFTKSFISLVRSGEASGKLGEVLERLAHNLEKQRDFKAKVKGALIYPIIVVIAMIVVFTIIIVFVMPQLVDMYESFGVELPLPTKIMIWLSDFIRNRWYFVIIALTALIFGVRKYSQTKQGNYQIARTIFKIPVFGGLLKQKDLTEFARSLSLLIASGVSIIDSLTITRESVSNQLYKDAVSDFVESVKKGESLSSAVSKNEYFPPIVARLVKVGEETGTTDDSLRNISEYFEKEVDRKVKNLSSALEPIIMIVLGIMVGLLVISVITPIYKLTSQF